MTIKGNKIDKLKSCKSSDHTDNVANHDICRIREKPMHLTCG